MTETCKKTGNDLNSPLKTIEDDEGVQNVEVYRFHKTYMSYLKLSFCIIDFNATVFISVNDESNTMNDLQTAYPLQYEDADNAICLVGDANSYGNGIARLLAVQFKIPFYVSVNIEERDENITNFIFSNCLHFLKETFQKKKEKANKKDV